MERERERREKMREKRGIRTLCDPSPTRHSQNSALGPTVPPRGCLLPRQYCGGQNVRSSYPGGSAARATTADRASTSALRVGEN